MNKAKRDQPYYGSQAYKLDAIPEQKPCLRHKSFGSTSVRLPWGSTQQVASDGIIRQSNPKSMRFWEDVAKEKERQKVEGTYTSKLFEGIELHQKYDQERFRFAQLPLKSQIWLFMLHFGKWGFIMLSPITFISHIAVIVAADNSWQVVTTELLTGLYPLVLGIPHSSGSSATSSSTTAPASGSVLPRAHSGS
nr:hypothetical protein [Pseudomonas viridiflava]